MPNKILGILEIVLVLGVLALGVFDPSLTAPHPNPIFNKLEIALSLALVIVSLWAGIRLITKDKKTPPGSLPPQLPQ